MDSNVSESLATLVRYGVVVVGILAAVESLGFDLATLNIGRRPGPRIGFGLQNVVNNIVSGFIILFECTVKKGDTIVVGRDRRAGYQHRAAQQRSPYTLRA